jgi:hypothetical protein
MQLKSLSEKSNKIQELGKLRASLLFMQAFENFWHQSPEGIRGRNVFCFFSGPLWRKLILVFQDPTGL